MSTIGTFTKINDEFRGSLETLTLSASARVIPIEKRNDTSPDYRVFVRKAEIGAGWSKVSNDGVPYISLKLDDPSFPAPIYATLTEAEDGGYNLIWSRPARG